MSKIFKALIFFITIFITILLGQYVNATPPPSRFSAKFPVFSKDNSKLIYLHSQNNSHAYNIIHLSTQTGDVIKNVPVKVSNNFIPFAATPDGFKLLAKNAHGIGVIHNGTGKVLRTLPHPSKIRDWRFTPVQSHDGVLLAIPSIGPQLQQLYLIHTGSGKVIRTIPISKKLSPNALPIIRAVGFNHNRHVLAYLQRDEKNSTLHIYDIYQQKEMLSIKMPKPYYDYGDISFSQNGQYLLFRTYGKKGITLLDLRQKTAKILQYDFSTYAGFTPDNKNIIIIQPFANSISIQNLTTGLIKRTAFVFDKDEGKFGEEEVIPSADKKLLALPYATYDYKKMDRFLVLDGNTGKLIRAISTVIEK